MPAELHVCIFTRHISTTALIEFLQLTFSNRADGCVQNVRAVTAASAIDRKWEFRIDDYSPLSNRLQLLEWCTLGSATKTIVNFTAQYSGCKMCMTNLLCRLRTTLVQFSAFPFDRLKWKHLYTLGVVFACRHSQTVYKMMAVNVNQRKLKSEKIHWIW